MRRLLEPGSSSLGIWLPITALIMVLGIAASVVGAQSLASSEARDARNSFRFASEEIASSLKLSISHEEDLVVSTRAHVVTSAQARSPVGFDRWIESVEAMRRFPELENIGLTVLVPASQLNAFQARMLKDPIRPFGSHGRSAWESEVVPNSKRPFYCLASAGMARNAQAYMPVGLDYCALAPTLTADRDAGQANYAPITLDNRTTLGVATPVYATGSPPPTVAARRRAFVGWLGELLVPGVVLGRALEGHPNVAVKFSFSSPVSHVAFSQGHIRGPAMMDALYVRTGWTLQTFAPAVSGLLFDRPQARVRLIGGVLLTFLACALILLLATGRRRALGMVADKTRELEHQATHDPLTGLPNRALVLDRAAQLIARHARSRTPELTAALFIDVDGFKEINDTMGHAAGDELLRTVSGRLQSTVRTQDTVGRLSGDEFVVLFEANPTEPIEALAERINRIMREPVALNPGADPVLVTASIGVACGRYATPDELLRDADLALYQAKAQGKDRHVVFSASAEAAPVLAGKPALAGRDL
jgi:diguanylate cyclase (GGDEF)-like protein